MPENAKDKNTNDIVSDIDYHQDKKSVKKNTDLDADIALEIGVDVEREFSRLLSLGSDTIVYEPDCPICNCSERSKIEEFFDKNKYNEDKTLEFAKEKSSAITKAHILNHMRHHREDRAVREIQKKEYVSRLRRSGKRGSTTMEVIDMSINILMERLLSINSIVPDNEKSLTDIERIKTQETSKLMSTMKAFLTLQASILGEMKDTGEVITIPTDQFIGTFKEAYDISTTESQRKIVDFIINRLKIAGHK